MVELRQYQKDAARKIWRALHRGNGRSRAMFQLPTGGGKTATGGSIAAQWLISHPRSRVTWITHRRELERQSRRTLVEDHGMDENRVEVISPLRAWNRKLHERAKDEGSGEDLLIIDEAHHSTARTWERLIGDWPGPALGMTATPWRLSKSEGFDHLYADLICGPTAKELIEWGNLVIPEVREPGHGVVEGRGSDRGDFSRRETWQEDKNRPLLVELGMDWLCRFGDRRAIVYGINVQHAMSLSDCAERSGRKPGLLLGKRAGLSADEYEKDRDRILSNFADGSVDTLINVEVASEGVDVPACDTVLMLRPTKSLSFYLQSAGRALRPSPGKDAGLILDAAANNRRFGLPDEDRAWSLEPRGSSGEFGEMPSKACFQCSALNPISERLCRHCGALFGQTCSVCGAFRTWDEYDSDVNGLPMVRCVVCSRKSQATMFKGEAKTTDPRREAALPLRSGKTLRDSFRQGLDKTLAFADSSRGISYYYSPESSSGKAVFSNRSRARQLNIPVNRRGEVLFRRGEASLEDLESLYAMMAKVDV